MSAFDVSVIVPTCGRARQLKQCLRSLSEQDYPLKKTELIVVDDRADKETEKILAGVKTQFGHMLYISQYCQGPAIARNKGVAASSGRIIAFIDDDCAAERDWLQKMIAVHDAYPEKTAVGGDTLTASRKPQVLASQFLSTGSIETIIDGKKEIIFFPTCNVSLKREVFREHMFEESFPLPGGEDLEFFWRLFKSGHRFVWDKEIKVIHYRCKSWLSFIKQAYAYGRGNLLVKFLHPDHPLLKEIKTGRGSFFGAMIINFLKIPRFSYMLGAKLKREYKISNGAGSLAINIAFIIHKLFYLIGNVSEYVRLKTGRLSRDRLIGRSPDLLILDITHRCNLQCRICDIWKTQNKEKDLDAEYVKKLLKEAQELRISEIAFSGGEPLLRGDIFELFKYAQGLGIKNLGVLTNGIVLKDKIEKLKPYILDNTIALVISLDSLDPKVHNYIRNNDKAWQQTNAAIKSLLELKQQYPQVSVNIISIVLNNNLEELVLLAEDLKAKGVDCLQFQGLLANNLNMAQRKKSEFWVSDQRLAVLDKTIDCLAAFKKQNKDFIKNSEQNLLLLKKYFRGQIKKNDVSCSSADKTILISNQGQCTTCFLAYGDARNKQIKHILKDKQIIAARKGVKNCAWPCLLPCFCDG